MDLPPPSTAIRKATEDCRRCLEECVLIPRLMNNEWAENRTVDFNLWIAGIGALAGKNASLDARLSSQPETSLVVVNLLILLNIFLERCKALASQDVEPEILHSPPIDQESEPVIISRRSSLSSQSSPERSLSPLSQISSSRSADIGEFDEPSDSQSSNASETDDVKPSSALVQARRNAEATLDNLTMVAFAIRRSGTSSRLLKADATFNPDSEEFLRLRNQLTFVLLAENRDPIAIKEPAKETADGPAVFSKDASAMSEVQQRLVEACLRRYNRFRYAQTHATKLETIHEVQLPEPTPEPRLPDQPSLPKDQHPEPAPARQPSPQQPRGPPAAPKGGVVSETMASEAASALHQKLVENSTPSQRSNTEISTNASRLQYPSPPKVRSDQQNFRCPCCCQTLPRMVLGRRKWRKHISEDLSPYTCIFDGCSKPDVLYITKDAWLNHIQKDHSTTIWTCVMCDTLGSFPNSEDFTEHIKSEHHETVSKDEIATVLSMCSITSPGTISSCPLCRWTDPGLGNTVEPNSLLDHIAEHIHSFSLRSLPWPPLGEESKRTAIANSGGESYIEIWLDKQLSQLPSDEPGEEHTAITGTVVKKYLEKADAFFASSAQDMCTDIDEKPIHEEYFYDNAYFGNSSKRSSVADNQTDLDNSSCITDEMPKIHDILTEGPENLSPEDRIDQDLLDQPKICLLSLDGGGIRGLSMLLILKELMTRLNQSREAANLEVIKPCHVFDLIAGTGTGGLIAIMLGRLEMDVDECISAFNNLTLTYSKSKSSLLSDISGLVPRAGTKATALAQLATLETAIVELITARGISTSQRLSSGSSQKCKVFVCATEISAENPTRLRSYSLPIHDDVPATICEAALATVVSSMENFFAPVQIGTIKFGDGDLADNNPVREVYGEASKMWYHKPGDSKSVPRCLVSIGIGGEIQIDTPYSELLRRSITETNKTAFQFKRSEPDYPYFRFDVDRGLQDVGLAEFKSYSTVEVATQQYLTQSGRKNDLDRCLPELDRTQDPGTLPSTNSASAYTVGLICALPLEMAAAIAMLDEQFSDPIPQPAHDNNIYTLGAIGRHNVVLACLPAGSIGSTAIATSRMRFTFTSIRFCLLVGIGGGAPGPVADIRLGDVVVSAPGGTSGGVIQYDLGRTVQGGQFSRIGSINKPPSVLLSAMSILQTKDELDGIDLSKYLVKVSVDNPRLRMPATYPGAENDRLFTPEYDHLPGASTCASCDTGKILARPSRAEIHPRIHYGLIASGNQVIRSGITRERLRQDLNVLCFEMEAAGMMDNFPCLVIRGICDYSDSHKNNDWQHYAAMTAAAYAKELLLIVPAGEVVNTRVPATAASEKRRSDVELTRIRSWLAPPDPSRNYHSAIERRQPDTGLWLLESVEYLKWKSTSTTSFLYLCGIPGSGKTILSSTIVQSLFQHCVDNPRKAVAYFYFDFNDTEKQDPGLMIRSLIFQLSQQCSKIPAALEALFSSCGNGQRQPSIGALLEVLQQVIKESLESYLVVDALDECANLDELMRILERIAGWRLEKLHILVTSRKELQIETSLSHYLEDDNIIHLQSTFVDMDIRKYVQHRLSVDKSLAKWSNDPDIRDEIEKAVTGGADGMFIWAVCQLDALGKCRSRNMVWRCLRTLPPTLDETYNRILCAVAKEDSVYALRILRWLAYSKRPLSLEELSEVVAIDIERNPAFDSDESLEDPRDILHICPGLITIKTTEEVFSNRGDLEPPRSIVAFVHYSVKEYLLSERIRQGQAAEYSMQAAVCEEILAKSCVGYLLQYQTRDSISTESIETSKLARYSAEYWMAHAKRAAADGEHLGRPFIDLLSSENGAYLNWLRIHDPDAPQDGPNFKRTLQTLPNPLYYAALGGLTQIVSLLIDEVGADINAQGGHYGNALQAASTRGHDNTVELLLRSGADVNMQGGSQGSALQVASTRDNKKVIQLLLDAGADVNAQGGPFGTALQAASIGGYEAVVQLLLKNGADINAQGGGYGNALQAASRRGHEAIVKLLLEKGADVSVQGGYYGNALQAASGGGHEAIVKLLLEKGADVSAQGGYYGNAVQAASEGGHEAIVKLLLKKGADINAQGGGYGKGYGNALQEALWRRARGNR